MSAATREWKLAGWERAVKGLLASDEGGVWMILGEKASFGRSGNVIRAIRTEWEARQVFIARYELTQTWNAVRSG